jgi:site-specific recombinase XerD
MTSGAIAKLDPDDLIASARSEILRAIGAGAMPDEHPHMKVAAWAAAAAPNSVRAMRADLRVVDAFQQRYSQPTLPLTPAQLHLLLDELGRSGKAKASISRLVASMKRLHALAGLPSCVDELVQFKLKQIRRTDTRPVIQARGLRLKGETHDVLEDEAKPLSLLALLDAIPCDPGGIRDRALLSIAYDAGLRRSEAVRIRVDHVERLPNGEGSLFIPRSKTDQEGEGARAWLSARSIDYLDEWLMLAQIVEGFVFRSLSYRVSERGHLSEAAVGAILKTRLDTYLRDLERDGQISPVEREAVVKATSSHSMRVGCDQDLFAAGLDIGAIMQGLRWGNPKQPLAYARHLAPSTSKLAALMRRARR